MALKKTRTKRQPASSATKSWRGGEVAKAMKVSIALVHVTRFRVTALLKQEVRRLEKAAEQALRGPA